MAFGRFAVRLLLHLLKKTDREKAFESVAQIQERFAEDCVKLSKPSGSSDEKASGPLEVTDVARSSMARPLCKINICALDSCSLAALLAAFASYSNSVVQFVLSAEKI